MLKLKKCWQLLSLLLVCMMLVNLTFIPPASSVSLDSDEYTNPNIIIHEVPKNFDPLKATDQELEYYNYPARPQNDSKALEEWKKVVATGKNWVKPKFAKTSISHNPRKTDVVANNSANWSGVVSGATTERVVGWWNCPKVYPALPPVGPNPAYSCHWVGLGGALGSTQLIQAGTESNTDANANPYYYTWWEIVNTSADTGHQVQISNVPVSPGNSMYADISFHLDANGNGIASFYVYNQSTGSVTSFSVNNITNCSQVKNSVEGIGERPLVYGSLSKFANYNYCNFTLKRSSTYNGSVSPLSSVTYYQIVDPQSQHILGTTGTYNTSSGSFTTYWNNYD